MHRFERKKPISKRLQWLIWLLAAVLVHLGVLVLLALVRDLKPPDETNKKPSNRHVVHMFRESSDKKSPPVESEFVSTEDQKAEKTTTVAEPIKSDRPVVPVPRPRPRPRPAERPPDPPPVPVVSEEPSPAPSVADMKPEADGETKPSTDSSPVRLFPTPEETERILGIQPRQNPPADVARGPDNRITSQRWMGASFFLRVREAVAQAWDPETAYRRHDPDGSVFGYKNWFTVLSITLDAEGRLLEPIIIAQPSGLRFLDMEAIRAIRAAAPFLNPPAEIVDPQTGRIRFRFGFLVEVHSGFSFRMFRF